MMQLDGLAGFDDQPTGARRDAVDGGLNFLWLELTNRCNLQCVHCYTESHPLSGDRDVLTTAAYESVMRQAYALGCCRHASTSIMTRKYGGMEPGAGLYEMATGAGK
jgi:2-iminoacetate synthase ThiH